MKRYNLFSGTVQMLVTNKLIPIKSRLEEIFRYSFSYIMHFRSYYVNYFIPVQYKLDRLPASTN